MSVFWFGMALLFLPLGAQADAALDKEITEFRKQVLIKCALREEGESVILDKTCMAKMAEKKLEQLCKDNANFSGKCSK